MRKVNSVIEIDGDIAVVKTFTKALGFVDFIIDSGDVNRVKMFNWKPCTGSHGGVYAETVFTNFEDGKKSRAAVRLHRLITSFEFEIVDHVNNNTLDNRTANLRQATRNQNAQNRGATKKSKSGLKGVYPLKKTNKFVSQIKANKKAYYLGVFETKELAAAAYNEAATKYHGEFAKLNIVNR